MSQFHALPIKDIRRETEDCVSIAFDIPDALAAEFRYKQGQYITIKLNLDGEEIRRSYSACSSPVTDRDLRIAVKRVENGKASTYLTDGIALGTTLDVMKPMGNFFTEMPPAKPQHYVAFAAGSGITPIMSLLKTALASDVDSTFTLVYGNRSSDQIIFADELRQLQANYGARLSVHHLLSREETADPLFKGRISAAKCLELFRQFPDMKKADEYFICGPFDMIMDVKDYLIGEGVSPEKVRFELFTIAKADETVKTELAEAGVIVKSVVTIVLDGDETQVTVHPNENILDAVLDAGLDAPYACTGGSCCTCRAKIIEGKAKMDVNYALTEKEVQQGYILTCQSHPLTPTMVVDYDQP